MASTTLYAASRAAPPHAPSIQLQRHTLVRSSQGTETLTPACYARSAEKLVQDCLLEETNIHIAWPASIELPTRGPQRTWQLTEEAGHAPLGAYLSSLTPEHTLAAHVLVLQAVMGLVAAYYNAGVLLDGGLLESRAHITFLTAPSNNLTPRTYPAHGWLSKDLNCSMPWQYVFSSGRRLKLPNVHAIVKWSTASTVSAADEDSHAELANSLQRLFQCAASRLPHLAGDFQKLASLCQLEPLELDNLFTGLSPWAIFCDSSQIKTGTHATPRRGCVLAYIAK